MKIKKMDTLEDQLFRYINQHYSIDASIGSRRKNSNPRVWGAAGWKFIDEIVKGYPVKAGSRDRIHMLEFLTSLGHVLPCSECRANHISFSVKHPPYKYVGGRKDVQRWIRMYKRMKNK